MPDGVVPEPGDTDTVDAVSFRDLSGGVASSVAVLVGHLSDVSA